MTTLGEGSGSGLRVRVELLGLLYEANRPHIEGALRGEEQFFEREIPDPRGGPTRPPR